MNKKGQFTGVIIFGVVLLFIMILAFVFGIGSAVTTWTADTVVPELTNLGEIGGTNLTEISELTITPANNVIQNLSWMTGVLYFLMLIGTLGLALAFRVTGNKWMIGVFFLVMLLVILGSILLSNFYEDFSSGGGEFALQLQSFTLLSFLIINSPLIITVIGFIGGVIMFSGMEGEVI